MYAQKQDNITLVISNAGEMIVLKLFFSEFQIVFNVNVSFYPKRFFPNLKIVTHFLKTIQIAILKKKTEIICSPFNDHFYLVNTVTKICL